MNVSEVKSISQQDAANIVEEMVIEKLHQPDPSLSIYEGEHPSEGRIYIIFSMVGDPVILPIVSRTS